MEGEVFSKFKTGFPMGKVTYEGEIVCLQLQSFPREASTNFREGGNHLSSFQEGLRVEEGCPSRFKGSLLCNIISKDGDLNPTVGMRASELPSRSGSGLVNQIGVPSEPGSFCH